MKESWYGATKEVMALSLRKHYPGQKENLYNSFWKNPNEDLRNCIFENSMEMSHLPETATKPAGETVKVICF